MKKDSPKLVVTQSNKKPFHHQWWFRAIARTLQILQVHRLLKNNSGYRSGLVSVYMGKRKYNEAYDLCVESMARYRNDNGFLENYEWWTFMYNAAWAAMSLNSDARKKQLMMIGDNGPWPCEESVTSRCLCLFSRWESTWGNHKRAIEYAKKAMEADPDSADPDFLLGWYELIVKNGNPLPYFKDSIEKDFSYFHQIVNDHAISKFPQIIKELKELKTA